MAIARNQINELASAVLAEVDRATLRRVLARFAKTQAYRSNISFRVTVIRIQEAIANGGIKEAERRAGIPRAMPPKPPRTRRSTRSSGSRSDAATEPA